MRSQNGKPPRERHRGGRTRGGANRPSSGLQTSTPGRHLDDVADDILARVYQRCDDLKLICHLLRRTSYRESARIARGCVGEALAVATMFEELREVFELLDRGVELAPRGRR